MFIPILKFTCYSKLVQYTIIMRYKYTVFVLSACSLTFCRQIT